MSEDTTVIRSRTNPALKRVGAALAGKLPNVLVLEGERLVRDALDSALELDLLLVAEDRLERSRDLMEEAREVRLVEPDLLGRVSLLETPPGVLALCAAPTRTDLSGLELPDDALVLVAAGISDPGNLGAIARSTEAAGASVLVVLSGGASPWSDKALRGSMGSLLRLPVVGRLGSDQAAGQLAELGFRPVAAATRGGVEASGFDWSGRVALWVGGETGELPAVCAGFERVSIPMAGTVESLNVTVAASVLLFGAGRAESVGRERD